MRHTFFTRFGKLGFLLCALALALTACEEEEQEPTGLEVEEYEVEREEGQIEEAEVELEREEIDEIDRQAPDELSEALRDEEPAQPDQQAQPGEQPQEDQQQQDLASVFVDPGNFVGVRTSGTATVGDVVSDRGFWLTDGDNRIFAIVREDVPQQEMIDINEGQRIELTGIMMAPGDPDDITGALEPETKQLAEQQDSLLLASWRDIQILEEAEEGAVGGGPPEENQEQHEQHEDESD